MASKKAAAKQPSSSPESMEKNRPFDTRVGRAVTLTWQNEKEDENGEKKQWRSIEAHTLYKNEEDEWVKGNSYGASDVASAKSSIEQALFDHHGGVDRELLGTLKAAVSLPREPHQPVKISCGAVEGLIWANEKPDGGVWYSFTHSCRYRSQDENGNAVMKNGKSYGRIEAHGLIAVLTEATKQMERLQGSPEAQMEDTKGKVQELVVERPNRKAAAKKQAEKTK